MIRYDEIMIGDYVLVKGTPRKVEAITKKKIGYHINPQTDKRLYYARLCECEHIIIDHEWLLRHQFLRNPSGRYINMEDFFTQIVIMIGNGKMSVKVSACPAMRLKSVAFYIEPILPRLQQILRMHKMDGAITL